MTQEEALDHLFQPSDTFEGSGGELICWAWVFSGDPVPVRMRCTRTLQEHRDAKLGALLERVLGVLERDYYDGESRALADELRAAFKERGVLR